MPISYDTCFAEYLTMPGAHFSALKAMAISPLHYHREATRDEHADTPALRLGRLVHSLVLTPELDDFVTFTGKARRGDAWKDCVAEAKGRAIVSAEEREIAERMRDAVYANPVARGLLREGHSEATVTWDEPLLGDAIRSGVPHYDRILGLWCKARIDHWGPAGLVELKTSRHAGQRAWFREAAQRHYHVQLAHYVSGLQEAEGIDVGAVWWIVVESVPPHDVAVYRVKREHIDAGDRVRLGWLRRVAECEASGRWPGAGGDEPIDYVLPDWAAGDGLEDVDMSGIEGEEVEHG